MKKLIIILTAVLAFNAVTAQNRNGNYNKQDRYQPTQVQNNRGNNNRNQWDDHAYNNNDRRTDQYRRQADYDRMNRDYDQRINGYRNDRSLNSYDRQRRINDAERERQEKTRSFGSGLIVGGVAAILIGAIISH